MKTLIAISLLIIITATAGFAAESPGAAGALVKDAYSLEEMLHYAIQDEWMAEAEYDALMEVFGIQRPFSNIKKAEMSHVQLLLPLFDRYGIDLPERPDSILIPPTMEEAYQIGIDAEIANIAMYKKFLEEEDLPTDVAFVFTRLMKGSENHLAAFQRQAQGDLGNMNRGPLFYGNTKGNSRGVRGRFGHGRGRRGFGYGYSYGKGRQNRQNK